MKNNVYLFQPQNIVEYDGSLQAWLPYSVACIWAYARQFDHIKENFDLKRVYATKDPIQEVLTQLDNPKICGFSSFVWNFNYNIAVASAIKTQWPNCTIIFGGPQITVEIINKHNFIDSIIESEGELLFKQLLDDYLTNNVKKIYTKQRISDLTVLPSAYSTDVFDNLIEQYPELVWATVLETNRGCPYHCTFCDWGSVTNSKIYQLGLDKLQEEINWIKKRPSIKTVNLADANFGILKERDLEIAKILRTLIDEGPIEEIDISYTKSYNTYLHEIVKILDQPTGFSMSFQSNNKDTLKAIKRKNLSEEDVNKLLSYAEDNHITHEQEYILGLPLETKESWYEGMTNLLDTGQHKVFDVFLCTLLPNTELATKESRDKYGLKTTMTPELNSVGPRNREDINEYSEIIKETSTLSESELIDCFLFSIIIMHTHCAGYTFVTSRIAHNQFGISGLEFYSALEKELYKDDIFGDHLKYIQSLLKEIFDNGLISDPKFKQEGRFDYMSYQFFYKNKDRLFNIASLVLKKLSKCDDDLIASAKDTQYQYIFDLYSHSNSTEFKSKFDLDTFKIKETNYTVNPKLTKHKFLEYWKGSGSFHSLHQSKQLINSMIKIVPTKIKLESIPIDIVI